MDRYNNINNTAPEVDPLKQKSPKIDKSDFDLSQALYFKALDGMIIPFWHLRVIPNSSIDLSISISAIMSNPYVKQLLTGKRAYIHVYHSNLSDIWEGAPELLKKGRDFNTKLSIPTLNRGVQSGSDSSTLRTTFTSGSPACYLGLPVHKYDSTISPIENIKPSRTGTTITDYSNFAVSCLPLVMYQQIYQAHYLNKNLINGNTDWLPQVENHFILPLEASGQSIAQLSYDIDKAKNYTVNNSENYDFNSEYFVPRDVDSQHVQTPSNKPFLNVMRFRQFKGDMFTSGSPFPDLLRGDVPVMSFSDLTGTIDWEKLFTNTSDVPSPASGQQLGYFKGNAGTEESPALYDTLGTGRTYENSGVTAFWYDMNSTDRTNLLNKLNQAVVHVQNQLSFNLNALRALDVYTLLGERAARTDGTYNNYIKTMFNVDPRYHMHEPRYLGGYYVDFVNSTIEQTSETNTTALGTVASRGIAKGNSHIGKFSFNDHGYIMAILDIVDETVYTQGVDRDWTDLEFEDQYLPLFNGLAPQATRVQELYLTGTKAVNEEPFNYVERYSHLKSKRNKALGQMSLPAYYGDTPIDLESCSYMHRRYFLEKPEFNNLWVTMTPKNVDMTPYTSTDDYPYLITATTNVDAVLPLPYITVPSGLAIMA